MAVADLIPSFVASLVTVISVHLLTALFYLHFSVTALLNVLMVLKLLHRPIPINNMTASYGVIDITLHTSGWCD